MRDDRKLTSRTVNRLAWKSGYRGVADLARHLGVHRVSIFRAANCDRKKTPLRRAIEAALAQGKEAA